MTTAGPRRALAAPGGGYGNARVVKFSADGEYLFE
jgi:hypothetical protein